MSSATGWQQDRKWTKYAVTALAALVMGTTFAGCTSTQNVATGDASAKAEARLKAELEETKAQLAAEEAKSEAAVVQAQALADAEAARAAQAAQAAEKAAAAAAVAKAKAAAQAKAVKVAAAAAAAKAAASQPRSLTGSSGGTDPRFDFCYNANDAGYGPYRKGEDPEYDWYRDNDGDGIVCEQ